MFTQEVADPVFIYVLRDPRSGAVCYVGKARSIKSRLASHLRDSSRRGTPVYLWIRELLALGLTPIIEQVVETNEEQWALREREIIQSFRSRQSLLNAADGGDQPKCSREVRAANARKVTALRTSTPLKRRIYECKRQIGAGLKSGHVGDATKEKLRYAASKRPDLFGCWGSLQ